ncbi:MAG: hypothetical protein ACYDHX_06005 [Methanothrix sp.]
MQGQEAAKPAGRFHRYLSALASVPGIFTRSSAPREPARSRRRPDGSRL